MTIEALHKKAFCDEIDDSVVALLGGVPPRWGRMTPLSRCLIIETGRALSGYVDWKPGEKAGERGLAVGLIGGTRRGSVKTDHAFIASHRRGPGMASPALFGYTLPNIPLAETAVFFGLTGPVYAVFNEQHPLALAEQEAWSLLASNPGLHLMLACEFDHFDGDDQTEHFSVILKMVERNGERNAGVSTLG